MYLVKTLDWGGGWGGRGGSIHYPRVGFDGSSGTGMTATNNQVQLRQNPAFGSYDFQWAVK